MIQILLVLLLTNQINTIVIHIVVFNASANFKQMCEYLINKNVILYHTNDIINKFVITIKHISCYHSTISFYNIIHTNEIMKIPAAN